MLIGGRAGWIGAAVLATLFTCPEPSVAAAAGSEPPTARPEDTGAALHEAWVGVYDNLEQIVFDADASADLITPDERRVRTLVAPVTLPWLGTRVLYLEEFLQDDPDALRRQVLLLITPGAAPDAVRVRQFTLREPWRWRHLYDRQPLWSLLTERDLQSLPGCDLLLRRDGEVFRGGTLGRRCALAGSPPQYVDYRMLIGGGQYWYRRRVLRAADDELVSEVVGYDWFELHEARLFSCRIRWSDGAPTDDSPPQLVVELPDHGGRARFSTPDGRSFELELHSQDWPFDVNRDALILLLHQLGGGGGRASSWSSVDADRITVELDDIDVSCGSVAPDPGERLTSMRASRPRASARG